VGVFSQPTVEGAVGTMQGLPVFLDANIPRIMVWGYFAFTFARYAEANSIIAGTGLITPTF
jgi:hypothetical protein